MNNHVTIPLALLALLAGQPWLDRAPHDLTDADRARIEEEVSAFLAAYLDIVQGDDELAIRGLYVDDERFAWFTDGEKRYTSGDEIIASLASMKGMTFDTVTSDLEILPLTPDLAHARTAFQTKLSQGGSVVFEYGGVITYLLEQDEDGAWSVLTGHTSTPKER